MKILKVILIFVLLLCLILIFNFFALKQRNETTIKILPDIKTPNLPVTPLLGIGEPVEISKVAPSRLISGENLWVYFIDGQIKREVEYKNNPVFEFLYSPKKDKFGYFVDYSNDPAVDYYRENVLYIENIQNRKPKEVFSGSFKVSGWEWFSNDEILVSEGCGTECQAEFLVDLKSGKEYVLQYGVDYTWSPDKKFVFAYNYSYRPGINVGDKFGNTIFGYHIAPPENYTSSTPLAAWSSDGVELALIMRKSNDKEFELLVFDSTKKFKKIFQSAIDDAEEFELKWTSDNKSVEVNGKSYPQIF